MARPPDAWAAADVVCSSETGPKQQLSQSRARRRKGAARQLGQHGDGGQRAFAWHGDRAAGPQGERWAQRPGTRATTNGQCERGGRATVTEATGGRRRPGHRGGVGWRRALGADEWAAEESLQQTTATAVSETAGVPAPAPSSARAGEGAQQISARRPMAPRRCRPPLCAENDFDHVGYAPENRGGAACDLPAFPSGGSGSAGGTGTGPGTAGAGHGRDAARSERATRQAEHTASAPESVIEPAAPPPLPRPPMCVPQRSARLSKPHHGRGRRQPGCVRQTSACARRRPQASGRAGAGPAFRWFWRRWCAGALAAHKAQARAWAGRPKRQPAPGCHWRPIPVARAAAGQLEKGCLRSLVARPNPLSSSLLPIIGTTSTYHAAITVPLPVCTTALVASSKPPAVHSEHLPGRRRPVRAPSPPPSPASSLPSPAQPSPALHRRQENVTLVRCGLRVGTLAYLRVVALTPPHHALRCLFILFFPAAGPLVSPLRRPPRAARRRR